MVEGTISYMDASPLDECNIIMESEVNENIVLYKCPASLLAEIGLNSNQF